MLRSLVGSEMCIRDRLAARLAAAGVQDALISATVAFLDRCDAARFSPGGVAADAMQRDYARAQEILRELRRAL